MEWVWNKKYRKAGWELLLETTCFLQFLGPFSQTAWTAFTKKNLCWEAQLEIKSSMQLNLLVNQTKEYQPKLDLGGSQTERVSCPRAES